jgi:hypothetical protein
MDDYPYISTFVSFDAMIQAWNKFKEFKGQSTIVPRYHLRNIKMDPTFIKNTYQVIHTTKNDYFEFNFLTDYFTEYSRVRAKRFDQELSSHDFWNKNKQEIKHKVKYNSNNAGIISETSYQKELRDILYSSTIEVMNFRLTIATTVYDIFTPSEILDPCSGHGDRAIAALSRSFVVKYEGCEPNLESQTRIQIAINTLGKQEKEFYIHPIGFEDFKIECFYDLVFTSPPYFDVEVYCDSDTQSIVKYPNKEKWYNEFLLPMFLRCWIYLKLNGHLIISINNVRHKNRLVFDCTERLVADISKYCNNCDYLGVLSFGDAGSRMEPMFIWKKRIK